MTQLRWHSGGGWNRELDVPRLDVEPTTAWVVAYARDLELDGVRARCDELSAQAEAELGTGLCGEQRPVRTLEMLERIHGRSAVRVNLEVQVIGRSRGVASVPDVADHLARPDAALVSLPPGEVRPEIDNAVVRADVLRFDGRHLVSVEGNHASVFDVATNQIAGSTIALPQAPTFAGLDGSGKRLIAFAGREISCWNWRDGTPCCPANELPGSPLRTSLAANAPVLAVSSGGNVDGRFFEHVRIVDLASGRTNRRRKPDRHG